MSRMVCTTWVTTSPPSSAILEALAACLRASAALSALCWTVLPSSSMAEAVSASELACCSVREANSLFPSAICSLLVAPDSAEPRTSQTVFFSRSAIATWAARMLLRYCGFSDT